MISGEMIEIMGPAFVTSLMIALTHAPLGVEVLKRGIIFIDLAVAQVAGLGLVIGGVVLHEPSEWSIQAIALLFATLAGLFFRFIESIMPKQLEAIIGSSFVLAASLTLLILADRPHGGEEIQHLLSGQVLFVTWQDVLMHAPIYVTILFLWFFKPSVRKGLGFYLIFAMAITSSVQLIGVYVVFASLILPSLSAVKVKNKNVVAWSCGITSVLLGVVSAIYLDMPAGPVIVISYFVVSIMTYTFFRLRDSWYRLDVK